MATVKTFRDLIAWQRAMELVTAIYITTRAMPDEEKFGLTFQMRKAAVSIPSNIAEGHSRQSRIDYLRFLQMARGSLAELMTQYKLATQRLMLMESDSNVLQLLFEEDRILQALIRSLEEKNRQ